METVVIYASAVNAKLHEPSMQVRYDVSDILSYRYQDDKGFEGYSSLFNMKKNSFPAGFVRIVKKKLEFAGYKVTTLIKPAPEATGPESPVVDDFPDEDRYDYQPQTMDRLVKLKRMVAQVATGGGKSRIFKLCEQRIGLPTLFLTTRRSLMWQMAEDYERSFGKSPGILGDGHWTPRPNGVNFAIVDTLASRLDITNYNKESARVVERWNNRVEKKVTDILKDHDLPHTKQAYKYANAQTRKAIDSIREKVREQNPLDENEVVQKVAAKVEKQKASREETLDLLSKIGFLCLEEAHELSNNQFYDVANACKNAHYRLALTATPFMKDEEESNMRLMAVTGPIGIKISEKLLIERGILAKPYFKYVKWARPKDLNRGTRWQRAYEIGIVENQSRNLEIMSECDRAANYGLQIMILVQREKHGVELEHMLNVRGIKSRFIYGKHSQSERQEALNDLKLGKIQCVIGSTIMDVGIDVPSVGLVILAGGGKAEVSLRQRIGRGLRAKKSGPNICFVVDFHDQYNNYLVGHYRERRRVVEDTPGFAENIVEDFDYKDFGLKRTSSKPATEELL